MYKKLIIEGRTLKMTFTFVLIFLFSFKCELFKNGLRNFDDMCRWLEYFLFEDRFLKFIVP